MHGQLTGAGFKSGVGVVEVAAAVFKAEADLCRDGYLVRHAGAHGADDIKHAIGRFQQAGAAVVLIDGFCWAGSILILLLGPLWVVALQLNFHFNFSF